MFEPWIGQEYDLQSEFPRTLILGESHYGKHHEGRYDLAKKTILCVEDQIVHNCSYRFFTRLVSSLTGRRPSFQDKGVFWHKVAYHNFITEPLAGPRCCPNSDQWKKSIATLPQVFADLKPKLCLVLGYRMWEQLHGQFDFQKIVPAGDIGPCGAVESNSMNCILMGMKHPSGRGFINAQWSGWIENLVQEKWPNKSFHADAHSSRR